jgi:hypothetical protein
MGVATVGPRVAGKAGIIGEAGCDAPIYAYRLASTPGHACGGLASAQTGRTARIKTGPYLTLPRKNDLDLGRDLVMRFAVERLPGDVEAIVGFFRHRGAYGKFKGLLERKGKLQEWFDYEEAAKESSLREWCAENGVELV